jgi:hypothetical protein
VLDGDPPVREDPGLRTPRSAAYRQTPGLSAGAPIGSVLWRWPSHEGGHTGGMEPQGPVLARGRDGVVYEHGSDKALRVVPDGRSLVREAEVMHYAASHGFPVPRVYGADTAGC